MQCWCIMNSIIMFLRSRYSKWGAPWLFSHMISLALSLVSHYADGVINCSITFLRSRQLNWDATWLIWSCDAFDTSITWCPWHQQWHHYIAYVKMIDMRCNMTFVVMWHHGLWHWHHMMPMVSSMLPLHFLGQDNQNWDAPLVFLFMLFHWYWHHMMPMALSVAQGTDASTGVHNSIKGHIIPQNNYLNITNAMVWLMAHISKTKQQLQLTFTILLPHMCRQQICSIKCHIYVTYVTLFMCSTRQLHQQPHMNSLKSTLSPQALDYILLKLLVYAPKHVCQPHQTCISHYTSNIVYM